MTSEPTLFECEECGIDYDPDTEGSDGMCEDCYNSTNFPEESGSE